MAKLAFGTLEDADAAASPTLIRGQKFDQSAHAKGVTGTLVDATEDAALIDLDELPAGHGELRLICRYD